jgi:hypothetical protein
MKKIFAFFVLLASDYTALAQTLQLEDTILVTRDRWRDTCFGLIDISSSLIQRHVAELFHENYLSECIK